MSIRGIIIWVMAAIALLVNFILSQEVNRPLVPPQMDNHNQPVVTDMLLTTGAVPSAQPVMLILYYNLLHTII